MTRAIRLGMLTPSSNTVLEPMTYEMLRDVPNVTAHFGRFQVLAISLEQFALDQFDPAPMVAAAKLLVDAKVDAICWNGTSAGWLGPDADRTLCREIEAECGVPATTSVLALLDLFKARGVTEYGLVTPYIDDVQARIIENFAGEGFTCVAERHLQISENFAFACVSEAQISGMIDQVVADGARHISVLCTNLKGAGLAQRVEAGGEAVLYDSVSTTIWGGLNLLDADMSPFSKWGRIFEG